MKMISLGATIATPYLAMVPGQALDIYSGVFNALTPSRVLPALEKFSLALSFNNTVNKIGIKACNVPRDISGNNPQKLPPPYCCY